ncbi:MAG: hypothetical protein COW65_04725 [Cytophagales bacterium CG18_big_fil_WC_8_21_14_2_50_42_9]|nr:MAG: hypothetical protein COW65_04725 [Cytophagales bacterium CG18_big_fil_WC_8_21_14_2_50_42_9]
MIFYPSKILAVLFAAGKNKKSVSSRIINFSIFGLVQNEYLIKMIAPIKLFQTAILLKYIADNLRLVHF